MFHSLKFWMVGISSIATCLLVFVVFQYFNESQQPNTTIMYTMTAKSEEPENQLMKKMAVSTETTPTKATQNNTKDSSE